MLIKPYLHNFLENIIFDFQIIIDRVQPVQIESHSDNVKIAKRESKRLNNCVLPGLVIAKELVSLGITFVILLLAIVSTFPF